MSRVADGALRAIGEDAGDPASKDAPHHIVFDRVIAIRRTIWDLSTESASSNSPAKGVVRPRLA